MFAQTVLPLVSALKLKALSVQYPFKDTGGRQRYCDFVIQEGDDVRIAIEIDGYDKRGRGTGMSRSEFVDWQRRQAALTSRGWYVLRFANTDVRDHPKRCAEHITLLLKHLRGKSTNQSLSEEEKSRLSELSASQRIQIAHLKKETGVMKTTIIAFTTLILALVLVIVWQSQGGSHGTGAASVAPIQLGASCENPLPWRNAGQHLEKTMAIVGPVMRTTTRDDVKGQPTWIEIGASYPNPERVVLVIWGQNRSEFPKVTTLNGKNACAMGRIESYRGVSQIELKTKDQLKILP